MSTTTLTRSESLNHKEELINHLENKVHQIRLKQQHTPKYMGIYHSMDKIASAAEMRLLKLKSWGDNG